MINRRIAIALLPVFFLFAADHAAQAQTPQSGVSEFSAQSKQRLRPRVRVYRYDPPFWEYPRPGIYSYPGPAAKRDCRAWYVLEHRPSGTVMTPRMRCDWVPG